MNCERCEKPIIKNDNVDEFTDFFKKSFMKKYAPDVDYCDDCFNGLKDLIDSFPDRQKEYCRMDRPNRSPPLFGGRGIDRNIGGKGTISDQVRNNKDFFISIYSSWSGA